MENITEIVAKNLRALRERKGLKQDELAEQLSIGQSTLSSYERGTRSVPLDMLVTFANFYNVSIDYLMGLSLVQSPNEDMQYIGTYTGLNDDAIEFLHFWNEHKRNHNSSFPLNKIDLINAIFDSDNDIVRDFNKVLTQIIQYLSTCSRIRPYKEEEILENLNNKFPVFCNLEFNDLMSEKELHQYQLTKSIEMLVENLNLSIVYDYNEGKYVDFHNALNTENYEFASLNEVVKHNKALFKKYEIEIWTNHSYDEAQIMLYEEKINHIKEIKQYVNSLKSQMDGEDDGK